MQQATSNKQQAFTLAEVLITLAVIGVVAALAIPALLTTTNNAENKTAAKKALAVASQAYMKAIIDNGGGFGNVIWNDPQAYIKFNALKNQLNVIKECAFGTGSKGNCWSSNGVGSNLNASGCTRFTNNSSQDENFSFVTNDGMYWMLYTYTATNGSDTFVVDVNGNKGPNDWGKDVFMFYIKDSIIVPFYSDNCQPVKRDGSIYSMTNENVATFYQ